MEEDKETSGEFPSFPLEDRIDEIYNALDSLPYLKGFRPMEEEKPLTIGGWITYDSKFHGIKPSRWRRLLARIWLKWSGWKFKLVGYDEFRRIVDEQNSEGH